MSEHQVICGNIGTVYAGTNEGLARAAFRSYCAMSKTGRGRAAGESVAWLCDDDIREECEGDQDQREAL